VDSGTGAGTTRFGFGFGATATGSGLGGGGSSVIVACSGVESGVKSKVDRPKGQREVQGQRRHQCDAEPDPRSLSPRPGEDDTGRFGTVGCGSGSGIIGVRWTQLMPGYWTKYELALTSIRKLTLQFRTAGDGYQ
jgi:hypothetical protein